MLMAFVRLRFSPCLLASFLVAITCMSWGQEPAVPATEKPGVADQTVFPGPEPVQNSDGKVNDKTEQPPPPGSNPNLRLGPGDLLEVSVYNVPELSTRTRISNTGDLYLPLIDYVHVAGLTTEESQKVIEKRLSDGGFVKDPHVALFVNESLSQTVSLLGEVSRPGAYPVYGERRLFDLLSAAGGLTDRAGRTITITHRNEPDKPINLHLARTISDQPADNVTIQSGDTVLVQKADIVYVVGEVSRPSGFLMSQGTLTVLQAVALAGGTTSNAKLNDARILRKGPDGVSETPIQLKKILRAQAPDVAMRSDDILFVPTSQGKVFGRRGIEAALTVATGVTIYTIR
jgi:polysaccharide export outer membrane protein